MVKFENLPDSIINGEGGKVRKGEFLHENWGFDEAATAAGCSALDGLIVEPGMAIGIHGHKKGESEIYIIFKGTTTEVFLCKADQVHSLYNDSSKTWVVVAVKSMNVVRIMD